MINSYINTFDWENFRQKCKEYVAKSSRSHEFSDETKIMVYPSLGSLQGGEKVRISEVIQDIHTNFKRKNVHNKNLLPVAYFSVSAFKGRRTNKNVTEHTGLVIFDIDLKDNPGASFPELKKVLQADIYTIICFTSPSGGLKLVFRTNIQDKEHHVAYFNSIKDYLLTTYKQINKIDPTGSNIARACYLPYDENIYYNPQACQYCLNEERIEEITKSLPLNKSDSNSLKALLEVDSILLEEHYENILNLIKKRTTVGLSLESNIENRTEVGLYDNIFNEYRYINIEKGVMSTSVPFLELLILKNMYPHRLDWMTRLDEYYFRNNPQKPISIDSIDGIDGLEICKVGLNKNTVIKEHFRAKTLGSISMKLIFNNPFCHPEYIVNAVIRINDFYCEDPHPYDNPKPNDVEVRDIVMNNYWKFLDGELDFSTAIRKKPRKSEVSRKHVFRSKQYSSIDRSITQLEAVRTYHEGRHGKTVRKLEEAIQSLQDGKKITQKRIAEFMGTSIRTVRRHLSEYHVDIIKIYNDKVKINDAI